MNQSDERKDNIQRVIETALDMFMENGIAATSMSATSIRLINFLLNVFIMYPPKKEIFAIRSNFLFYCTHSVSKNQCLNFLFDKKSAKISSKPWKVKKF